MPEGNPWPPGTRLGVKDYQDDYEKRFNTTRGHASWKLERRQSFREPGYPSWEAFVRGDWPEALRLIETEREELDELSKEADERDIELFRVRVVEEPFSPYLHWELYLLKVRAECGEKIRVVTRDQVERFEAEKPLPEVLTVGSDTVYRILYREDGVLEGAVRIVAPGAVENYTRVIEQLYDNGEQIERFFQREVAPLEPPRPE
ncbi:DUF6879 family protein [Amycolatopsis sp. H20-H5]|uniref:DUF6879 family protein n=1 Tax=Amycolatopsis sp. H20-H5 TaxID=3046309 RepID=UPI002DB90C0F|nr:DUF6879 family protein [Amycolatopsis sp. H20-H5]MEC3982185.1 hypothetical protein [Amycolatopsis sp. H20-H5]